MIAETKLLEKKNTEQLKILKHLKIYIANCFIKHSAVSIKLVHPHLSETFY